MKTVQYNWFRANFAKILKTYQSNSFGSFIAGKKKLVFRQETRNTKQTRLSLVFQWRFRISIYSAILLDWVSGIHWVLYNRSESIITIVSASRQIFLFDWKEVSTTQQSKIKSPDLSLSLSLFDWREVSTPQWKIFGLGTKLERMYFIGFLSFGLLML